MRKIFWFWFIFLAATLPLYLAAGPEDAGILRNLLGLGGSGIIVALVSVYKKLDDDTRRYPLAAVVLGIVLNLFITWVLGPSTRLEYGSAAIGGISVGMTSAGFYSWGSTVKEGDAAVKSRRPPPAAPPQ